MTPKPEMNSPDLWSRIRFPVGSGTAILIAAVLLGEPQPEPLPVPLWQPGRPLPGGGPVFLSEDRHVIYVSLPSGEGKPLQIVPVLAAISTLKRAPLSPPDRNLRAAPTTDKESLLAKALRLTFQIDSMSLR